MYILLDFWTNSNSLPHTVIGRYQRFHYNTKKDTFNEEKMKL